MNNLVELSNGELDVASEVKKAIYSIENEIKKLTEMKEKYKQALIKEIEDRGMTKCSITNDMFTLTYKSPSTRESLDSKRLKEDMPEIYDEYVKIIDVSSSISVKLKEQE